jgi:hypothetical protein
VPDPSPFLAQAERLADRFRSMPQSKLVLFAPLGLQLARRLADRALQLEGLPGRELPDAGVFAVGDQLALAAHELAAALAADDSGTDPDTDPEPDPQFDAGRSAPGPEADGSAQAVLAEALRLVAELAQRLATTRSARM